MSIEEALVGPWLSSQEITLLPKEDMLQHSFTALRAKSPTEHSITSKSTASGLHT